MAIRLVPESAEALHARGLLYQKQGMHPQAILDFDSTIDRNAFVAAPYAARGQSLVATQQYEKAIEDFNAALNVNNRDAEFMGLARRRLRAHGQPADGDRKLPARARHRQRQPGRPAGQFEAVRPRSAAAAVRELADIADLLKGNSGAREVLAHVERLHLPDCWVGAGFVRTPCGMSFTAERPTQLPSTI